jgi:hypothetical protein
MHRPDPEIFLFPNIPAGGPPEPVARSSRAEARQKVFARNALNLMAATIHAAAKDHHHDRL